MTKKDGDIIRDFQKELRAMQRAYGLGTATEEAMKELELACELTLRGRYFEVTEPRSSSTSLQMIHTRS